MPKTNFQLNGKATTAAWEPGMTVLDILREDCGVASCKNGCAPEGTCGCCAVVIDGQPALACLRKPEHLEGSDVVTLEGLDEEMRRILGEAFVLEGGVQCGFCIPGIVMRASGLIRQGKTGDRAAVRKALDGHLCRCTGYARIVDAIQTAGEVYNNGRSLANREPRRPHYFGEQYGLTRTTTAAANANGVGRSPARYYGIEQAFGERPFVDDMRVPGMLHGAPVLSDHPRAKVLALHLEAARAMPGVERIFTASDVPGLRGTGITIPDLPIFVAVGETTCCVGDMFALVVADTRFPCQPRGGCSGRRLRSLRTRNRSFRGASARRAPGARAGQSARASQSAGASRFLARRCRSRISQRRAHRGADLRHPGGGAGVSSAGSLPGAAPGRRHKGIHPKPGLHFRSESDREGFEPAAGVGRNRFGCQRRSVRRQRSCLSRRRPRWRRF